MFADTLSHAYLKENDSTSYDKDSEVINMLKYLPLAESRVKDLKFHTHDDELLQVQETTVIHGWLIKREDTPSLARNRTSTSKMR